MNWFSDLFARNWMVRYATTTKPEQESGVKEHKAGDGGGEAPKAGRRHRAKRAKKGAR